MLTCKGSLPFAQWRKKHILVCQSVKSLLVLRSLLLYIRLFSYVIIFFRGEQPKLNQHTKTKKMNSSPLYSLHNVRFHERSVVISSTQTNQPKFLLLPSWAGTTISNFPTSQAHQLWLHISNDLSRWLRGVPSLPIPAVTFPENLGDT